MAWIKDNNNPDDLWRNGDYSVYKTRKPMVHRMADNTSRTVFVDRYAVDKNGIHIGFCRDIKKAMIVANYLKEGEK